MKSSAKYQKVHCIEKLSCYTTGMQPKLIVEQKITPLVNRYAVYAADQAGEKGQLVALAQQKRMAFKEKINFFTDEQQTQLAFSFRAEKVMDIHGRFLVEDANGQLIGVFRKDFKQSLVSSTWHLVNAQDQPVLTLSESNPLLAALRRYIGFVPIIGEFLDVALNFIKYHFTIRDAAGNEVGRYMKQKLYLDHYSLNMTDQAFASQDWRVLAALAVALDALQSR